MWRVSSRLLHAVRVTATLATEPTIPEQLGTDYQGTIGPRNTALARATPLTSEARAAAVVAQIEGEGAIVPRPYLATLRSAQTVGAHAIASTNMTLGTRALIVQLTR